MRFITGQAIGHGAGQGLGKMVSAGIGGEIIYSFVIIFCSLLIYSVTRKLYRLSSYNGIKYFGQSFLFFALAYFFRSFIKIVLFYFEREELRSILPFFGNVTLFVFMYFSSMAIFYLLYSVIWKRWNSKYVLYLFHVVSLVTATVAILFKSPLVHLSINVLLFCFISFTVYISYKQSKKKRAGSLYVIYLLLFIFWILNILDILIPNFLQTFQLLIYLSSIGIFLLILYKVVRRAG